MLRRMPCTHSAARCAQESACSGAGDVQALALEAVGNLAFCRAHTAALQGAAQLRPLLKRLASPDGGAETQRARMAAIRALAILGGPHLCCRCPSMPSFCSERPPGVRRAADTSCRSCPEFEHFCNAKVYLLLCTRTMVRYEATQSLSVGIIACFTTSTRIVPLCQRPLQAPRCSITVDTARDRTLTERCIYPIYALS